MPVTALLVVELLAVGLIAGLLGGLAGIGGSMVMLPALHLFLGEPTPQTHHLYMAAAMTVNIAVALPAALRHHRLGAVRTNLLAGLLPVTVAAMIAGVLIGNAVAGERLRSILAAFLAAYALSLLVALARRRPDPAPADERTDAVRLTTCGAATGIIGGLLGLGGGVIMVPLLQTLARVPLRSAIATSSAVICVAAVPGAAAKLASLPGLNQSVSGALIFAALMAPTAVVGARLGATLTHRLPLRAVRAIVAVLLLLAAARLAT